MDRMLIITSDIHGDAIGVNLIKKAAEKYSCQDILSAGDQCPDSFDPFYRNLIAVRGNSDRFYEYEDIQFPPLYRKLAYFGKTIYMTHGDIYSYNDFDLRSGDIFISGHTHVPLLMEKNGIYLLNPGSPSRPRSSLGPTAILLDKDFARLISLLDFSQISALSISSL